MKIFNIILLSFTFNLSSSAQSVCLRTPQIREAIVKSLKLPCNKIQTKDLYKIKVLDLNSKNITTFKKNDFKGLSFLKELSLFDNKVAEIKKGTFKDLHSLKRLNLGYNRLNFLNSEIFEDLTNLEDLAVYHNPILKISENTFQNLLNLKSLYLGELPIKAFPEKIFQKMNKLENLIISYIELPILNETLFNDLVNLKSLALTELKLTKLQDMLFSKLISLESLDLGANKISSKLTNRIFYNLKNLKQLDLGSNHISEIDENAFTEIKHLEKINLAYNKLKSLHENTFFKLEKLSLLYLTNNSLESLMTNVFGSLKSLKVLDLSYNKMDQLPDNIFNNLKSVLDIKLSSNKVDLKKSRAYTNAIPFLVINNFNQLAPEFENIYLSKLNSFIYSSGIDYNFRKIPYYLFSVDEIREYFFLFNQDYVMENYLNHFPANLKVNLIGKLQSRSDHLTDYLRFKEYNPLKKLVKTNLNFNLIKVHEDFLEQQIRNNVKEEVIEDLKSILVLLNQIFLNTFNYKESYLSFPPELKKEAFKFFSQDSNNLRVETIGNFYQKIQKLIETHNKIAPYNDIWNLEHLDFLISVKGYLKKLFKKNFKTIKLDGMSENDRITLLKSVINMSYSGKLINIEQLVKIDKELKLNNYKNAAVICSELQIKNINTIYNQSLLAIRGLKEESALKKRFRKFNIELISNSYINELERLLRTF